MSSPGRVIRVLASTALLAAACASCSSQKPAAAPAVSATPARSLTSNAAQRRKIAVTVYNSNFALVKEERSLPLGRGRVELAYGDVSAHIQPETVHIRAMDEEGGLVVLEQNYRYDLLSPEKLLEKYVGRTLKVARYNEELGQDELRDAELLAVQGGPVLRIDGEIVTGFNLGAAGGVDRFIFPELPDNLMSKPTLVWLLESAREQQDVEVSYLTHNLTWNADYVLVLGPEAPGNLVREGDLSGWVTLDNQSGTSFHQADLRLVAGDVQRVAPPPPAPMPEMDMDEEASGGAPAFRQEALFEYHLYALQRPTDLLDKERKQVSLLEAPRVSLSKKLVLRGREHLLRARFPQPIARQQVSVLVVIDNDAAHGLGMPLPQGTLRVYQADREGALQFVGEDRIAHTPRDERVEVRLGEAFDVVADRRQVQFRALGRCAAETDWEIELRNHKEVAEQVEVVEPVSGDWKVTRASHPPSSRDATELVFRIDVPAQGAVKLTYGVRVSWC